MDFTPWIPDSLSVELGFRISIFKGGSEILELYSRFQIPGFQISIFNGVPNSLSGIPDFKSQGSGVHKQKFPVKGEGGGGGGSEFALLFLLNRKPVYLNLTLYVCIPSFMSILFTTHNLHGTILLLRCTQGYQKQLTEA